MTTVFAFLGLLVLTMMASASFFERYGDWFSEPARAPVRAVTSDASAPGPEIAVVLAAIEAHRRNT